MFSTAFTYMAASGGFDPDAEAFFEAAGITDATQKNAVNQLVVDLKDENLWSSFYALYPIVGTTSSQQSYNLIDTATYQITWNGGWTHSSTGALGNGSNTYANAGIVPSTVGIGLNSFSVGTYNRISGLSDSVDCGVSVGENQRINLYSNLQLAGIGVLWDPGSQSQRQTAGSPSTNGFYIGTRSSSTTHGVYRNGSALASTTTSTNSATSLPDSDFFFGAISSTGTPELPTSNEYALFFFADGFTASQISTFNTIVQTFQTTLGRNV